MSDYSVIIPARYGSSRLPGKPLLDIGGKPMIQRVYEQACRSTAKRVVVATDDARIEAAARAFGADVVMTAASHESGTDRLQEVVSKLQLGGDEIVVNVQGDEPLVPPAVIEQVAANLAANPAAQVATLCETLSDAGQFFNPNVVKVVSDAQGLALYFSRAPIPWGRDHFAETRDSLPANLNAQRHIGIYAYRVATLHDFVSWPMAPLEKIECLEQLRVMYNGGRIHVDKACEEVPGGVDTEADLQLVRRHIGA